MFVSGLALHSEQRSSYKVGSQTLGVMSKKEDTRDISGHFIATEPDFPGSL